VTDKKKFVLIPGSRLAALALSKDQARKACLESLAAKHAREAAKLGGEGSPVADFPNHHCRPDSALPVCPDMPPPPERSVDLTRPVPGCPSAAPAPVHSSADVLVPLETSFLEFLMRTGAAPQGTVTNAIVLVTPAIAHAWLRTNHHNRKPSTAKIERFAAAMKAGRWTLTGEAIKFDTAGELLDGQSRLRALIQSDTSVLLEVRWGLPRAAQETMDTGEARSHAHQLQIAGVKYSTATAAALRMVWVWEAGGNVSGDATSLSKHKRRSLTNTSIRETYERHPKITESIARYGSAAQAARFIPLSRIAGYHYLFGLVDRAKSDVFWDGVVTGVGLQAGTPVFQLRERLVGDRLSQTRITSYEQAALIIKAWNAHYLGERLQRLAFRFKGDDPEVFPTIAGDPRTEKAGAA
jgi:hypothetical protein